MIKKIILILVFILLMLPSLSTARTNITDWYLKDFAQEIVVNKDSSLDITEKITADCGNLPSKHGIYRVLPTQARLTDKNTSRTPVRLISITDFNDKPITYQESEDNNLHTITWKIGDADKTVTGVNYYKIKYQVKNAIRFGNSNFDELYWNLNGSFWDIETDKFSATVKLPEGVHSTNAVVYTYSGVYQAEDAGLANYSWLDPKTLVYSSTQTLMPTESITTSVTFPKNIFIPYEPSFLEKYGGYFYLFLPFFAFIICFYFWFRFGRDPKGSSTIAPEFGIPDNISPMQMGVIMTDGTLKPEFITAAIVALAVKKVIKIKEVVKKGIFGGKDYQLTLLNNNIKSLTFDETALIDKIFAGKNEVLISSLAYRFQHEIIMLNNLINDHLSQQKYLLKNSKIFFTTFFFVAMAIFFGVFLLFQFNMFNLSLVWNMILSGVIVLVFSFLMRARSKEGLVIYHRILGFKLYMKTAERYRQKFFEKENIFDRFLPYAMVFGITNLWIKKMKSIYGDKYFNNYYPYWYVGMIGNFNEHSFSSAMDSLASNMSASIAPSSSGAGGGGFAGGGGGGGGGGGW